MHKFGPCKLLRKFSSRNAYEMELPDGLGISPIFNIIDLHQFHESEFNEDRVADLEKQLPRKEPDQIEDILDSRIGRSTRSSKYMEYLVKWKDRPIEDSSWISQAKVDRLGFPLTPAK